MDGYIEGYTDNDNISYCPKCGAQIKEFYGDGTARCNNCGTRFGVVERDDD